MENRNKNKSIKIVIPKVVSIMIILFLIWILPVNIYIQLRMQHRTQKESTVEMFGQVEQLINTNAEELKIAEEDFKNNCIRAADIIAYYVEQRGESTLDRIESLEMAEKVNVDEIHFVSPKGEIIAGTHPQYYGYTFDSGEQMQFFKSMLKDRSMKLCQDVTPNSAERKEMLYAAVWLEDGSGIVQIGMKPRRLMQRIEEKSLKNVVDAMPFAINGSFHIVDKNTYEIVASTDSDMKELAVLKEDQIPHSEKISDTEHFRYEGKRYCVYTKEYRDYILVRMYDSLSPVKSMLYSSGMVIFFVLLGSIGIIIILRWYIQKELSNNLTKIVCELQKVEKGSLDNIHIQTGITEFEELLFYINQMLNSVRLNQKHIMYLLNKSEIPVGFVEKNVFYHQTFFNHKLIEILEIRANKMRQSEELDLLIEEKINEIKKNPVSKDEAVYKYYIHNKEKYLQFEEAIDDHSIVYYVVDITHFWKEANQIKLQSLIDELTGLYNRRGFYEQMSSLFEQPDCLGFAAMLMIDADGLKVINDTYGHFMGDRYLKAIAEAFHIAIEEKVISARLGGDEFAVFLYGFSSMEDLGSMILQIEKERGSVFMQEKNHRHELQFSMGIAYYPEEDMDFHELMRIADGRMYQDKKSRKSGRSGNSSV